MELTMNLPRNYVEIEEEEMMYLDGGWRVTINRRTINSAFCNLWSAIGDVSTAAWLASKSKNARAIGAKIISNGYKIAKSFLRVLKFGSFWTTALAGAFAGIVIASAMAIGVVYATNSSISFGF